jgi:hypothetical protein
MKNSFAGIVKLSLAAVSSATLLLSGCGHGGDSSRDADLSCDFFRRPGDFAADRHDPRAFIAHAGGEIGGERYTNSLEAVQKAIERGYRLIELDLLETTDGYLVAAHDWGKFHKITGNTGSNPISLEEFRSRRIYGRHTPLSEVEIREILRANPDLILVTDKIQDPRAVIDALPFKDRVVMELSSLEDYQEALDLGVKYPLYSLDGSSAGFETVFARRIPLVAFPAAALQRPEGRAFLRRLHRSRGCAFVYSSNEEAFIRDNLALGVTAFYTDAWNPALGSCDGITCTTY